MKRLMRRPEVEAHCGLSRSEIYRLISIGEFPKPVPLGTRAVAWDSDKIEAWINAKINKQVAA